VEPTPPQGEVAVPVGEYKTASNHDPTWLARIAKQVATEFDVRERHSRARKEAWATYRSCT
jgi:hypothetical protein